MSFLKVISFAKVMFYSTMHQTEVGSERKKALIHCQKETTLHKFFYFYFRKGFRRSTECCASSGSTCRRWTSGRCTDRFVCGRGHDSDVSGRFWPTATRECCAPSLASRSRWTSGWWGRWVRRRSSAPSSPRTTTSCSRERCGRCPRRSCLPSLDPGVIRSNNWVQ